MNSPLEELDSPGAGELQLFHEGAGAAQHADSGLQHLAQGWTRVGQALQIHTVPQRLIKPGGKNSIHQDARKPLSQKSET